MALSLGGTIRPDLEAIVHNEESTMATSKRDASKASKLLRTSKNKTVRSVAGSDLAQAKHKRPKKK